MLTGRTPKMIASAGGLQHPKNEAAQSMLKSSAGASGAAGGGGEKLSTVMEIQESLLTKGHPSNIISKPQFPSFSAVQVQASSVKQGPTALAESGGGGDYHIQ
jgi:hypothetical protein